MGEPGSVPGVRDVAALAGVSPSTVSNYLNRPDVVRASTRLRIDDAVDRLGFVRNESARQLRSGSGRTFGVVLLDAWIPFFGELASGVEDTGVAAGWTVLFSNSARDPHRELRSLDVFAAQRVRGLLVVPQQDLRSRLRRLQKRGIACVTMEQPANAEDISSVEIDDMGGGRVAAEHLLGLGRRRIALVGNPARVSHVHDRFAGFTAAVDECPGARWQLLDTAGLTLRDGSAAARRLLALDDSDRPDAVFAANDLIGVGLLHELIMGGVDIPGETAVLGYDGLELAAHASVPLSTVVQPAYEMGAAAAGILIAGMEGLEPAGASHRVFQPFVVARESTIGPALTR